MTKVNKWEQSTMTHVYEVAMVMPTALDVNLKKIILKIPLKDATGLIPNKYRCQKISTNANKPNSIAH